VRCDRAKRSIKLSIEAYVNKLVADYNCKGAAPCYTLTNVSILSLKKRAANNLINDRELKRY
jgi:hypothetical protein